MKKIDNDKSLNNEIISSCRNEILVGWLILFQLMIIGVNVWIYFHYKNVVTKYENVCFADSVRIASLENEINLLREKESSADIFISDSITVSAKSHIELFHYYFFTQAPDQKYIDHNIEKAMNLADERAYAMYKSLREKNFYNEIIRSGSLLNIFCDSIDFNSKTMEFKYYGRQRIERRTDVRYRKLVTTGKLVHVPHTIDNPLGYLITDWRIVKNEDIFFREEKYR